MNKSVKYIAFLIPKENGKGNAEDKIQINSVNDLFNFKERIINRVVEIESNYAKK